MKQLWELIIGLCGGTISAILGGFDYLIYVLILVIVCDYVSGILAAALFQKSPKSTNGGLDSNAGFKGLVKKCMIILCVAIAAGVDHIINGEIFRNMVIIGFIVNELISFLENLSLMGVKYPEVMNRMLNMLNERSEKDED